MPTAKTGIVTYGADTDVPASSLDIKAGNALPSATTNKVGGDLNLAAGIGVTTITINDYTTLAGVLFQISVDAVNNMKTEGVDWNRGTSNNAAASSLATAISTISGLSASANANIVTITPVALTIRSIAIPVPAGANVTVVSGAGRSDLSNNNDGKLKLWQNIEYENDVFAVYVRNPWSGGNSKPMLVLDRADENVILACWSVQITDVVGGTTPGLGFRVGATAPGQDVIIFNGGTGHGENNYIFTDFNKRDTNHGVVTGLNPTLYVFSGSATLTHWISAAHNQTDGVVATGAGALQLLPSSGIVKGSNAAGWGLTNVTAGPTVPTLVPNMAASTSGVGADASGVVSIVSNATEVVRVHSSAVNLQKVANVHSDLNLKSTDGTSQTGRPRMLGGANVASATAPNIIPRSEDGTTGIGSDAAGNMSLIANSVEKVRVGQNSGVTHHHPVLSKTANYTVLDMDSATLFTNDGATGAVTLTLPAATPGRWLKMVVIAAQIFKALRAGTDVIRSGATTNNAISASNAGDAIELVCYKSGEWVRTWLIGTWGLSGS